MGDAFASRHEKFRRLLARAVALELPHPFRPLHAGRPAAVLILAGLREGADSLEVLMTRRTENLETHKGQYALPGGMQDFENESPEITALRETEEEMGISRENVEVFGALPPIWTPSGFTVTPVVGLLHKPIEKIVLQPNLAEIDLWFWCDSSRLRDPGVYSAEAHTVTHAGKSHAITVDVYQVDTHRIWGATGAMLRNFLTRLEAASDLG